MRVFFRCKGLFTSPCWTWMWLWMLWRVIISTAVISMLLNWAPPWLAGWLLLLGPALWTPQQTRTPPLQLTVLSSSTPAPQGQTCLRRQLEKRFLTSALWEEFSCPPNPDAAADTPTSVSKLLRSRLVVLNACWVNSHLVVRVWLSWGQRQSSQLLGGTPQDELPRQSSPDSNPPNLLGCYDNAQSQYHGYSAESGRRREEPHRHQISGQVRQHRYQSMKGREKQCLRQWFCVVIVFL